MTQSTSPVDPRLLAAALRWWDAMGVDCCVEADSQPWLGRAPQSAGSESDAPSAPIRGRDAVPANVGPAPVPEAPLPDTLPALAQWLATDPDVPEAGPANRRLPAFGTVGAPIIIVTDMPDTSDIEAGALFSGEVGQLFDAMLRAIGLDRSGVYGFALCPGRPASGRISAQAIERLGVIARHHIGLAGGKRVWSFGQTTSRALLGVDATAAMDKNSKNINHFGGSMPCITSLHPRLLLQAPQRKAAVWKDMQLLVGGLN